MPFVLSSANTSDFHLACVIRCLFLCQNKFYSLMESGDIKYLFCATCLLQFQYIDFGLEASIHLILTISEEKKS